MDGCFLLVLVLVFPSSLGFILPLLCLRKGHVLYIRVFLIFEPTMRRVILFYPDSDRVLHPDRCILPCENDGEFIPVVRLTI